MKNRRIEYKKSYLPISLFLILIAYSCTDYQKPTNIDKPITLLEPTAKIRFIGQWLSEGKREKLVRDFTRNYGFQNQHIDIQLEFPENIYFDRTVVTSNQDFVSDIITQENPEWDIIRINDQFEDVAKFTQDSLWAKKNLVDFSVIPEFIKNTHPDLLSEANKKRWGGMIPGPFIEGQYWALWSNSLIAKKVGIDVKQFGMTIDDFIGYIKAVNKYNSTHPDDFIIPFDNAVDWETSIAFIYHLFASALNNKELLYSSETSEEKLVAWHKTLIALEELGKNNIFYKNWRSTNWNDSKLNLINEKCLFFANGSWMYNIWNQIDPAKTLNCYPNEFPVFNEIDIYPGGYLITWAVLKKSPNKDAAVDFLLAMNNSDVAEMWVQYTKCPTGINGKFTDVLFGADQFENFSSHVQSKYKSNTYKINATTRFIVGDSSAKTYYLDVIEGKLSANEAMKKIRSAI